MMFSSVMMSTVLNDMLTSLIGYFDYKIKLTSSLAMSIIGKYIVSRLDIVSNVY